MNTLRLMILFLCFVLSGCEVFESNPPEQKYLFDVYYVNYAWGFTLRGIYIDKNGDMFSYQVSPTDTVSRDSLRIFHRYGLNIKERDLDIKFSFNKKFVKNIGPAIAVKKLGDLYNVPLNAYSDTLATGADMGAYLYSGYIYDVKSNTYREVELKVSGDVSYYNTSTNATRLVDWLSSLTKDVINPQFREKSNFPLSR
ncbi:MAG: hypothetical protein ACM3MI_11725 [Clostridiales bacterium]